MGVNKLNDMKTIIEGTTLEDSWKTLSNHRARKNSGKEAENSRPGAKFYHKSNRQPKREVTG